MGLSQHTVPITPRTIVRGDYSAESDWEGCMCVFGVGLILLTQIAAPGEGVWFGICTVTLVLLLQPCHQADRCRTSELNWHWGVARTGRFAWPERRSLDNCTAEISALCHTKQMLMAINATNSSASIESSSSDHQGFPTNQSRISDRQSGHFLV
jgi:hypothetical protein